MQHAPNAAPNTPAAAPVTPPPAPAAPPPVPRARMKRRHWAVIWSFLAIVILPSVLAAWYLWTRAADQYSSDIGFSVRTEETGATMNGLLGGLTALSGSSSKDTDILYEFLQSQKLVADMDRDLDLTALWSKPGGDPVFVYDASGTIEDLVAFWNRMVRIDYEAGVGLIEIRVLAFDPADATLIAETLFTKSTEMINQLSAIAREDAIRYAREDLATAVERLKVARQAVTAFRVQYQIVDPSSDIQTQTGLLGTLQAQLAEAMIDVDLLADTTRAGDPRLVQAQRRVEVIENRIAAERDKVALGAAPQDGADTTLAALVGEYEGLAVDREFAEQSYVAALATYDVALGEARRKSRYLAAFVVPTLAESSQFPKRGVILAVVALFLVLFWAISVLVAYSLKDRR